MFTPQICSAIRAILTAPLIRPGKFRPGLKALLMLPFLFSSSRLLASAHDGMSAAGTSSAPSMPNAAAQTGSALSNSAQGLGQSMMNTPAATVPPVPHVPPIPGADSVSGMAFSWGSYLHGIGMLFLLLGLLWVGVWLLKRYGMGKFKALTGRGRNMELVEVLNLGPKRSAVMVRVKDRTFLLGVTEQRISMLSEIYDDAGMEAHDFQPGKTQSN